MHIDFDIRCVATFYLFLEYDHQWSQFEHWHCIVILEDSLGIFIDVEISKIEGLRYIKITIFLGQIRLPIFARSKNITLSRNKVAVDQAVIICFVNVFNGL